MSKPTADTQIRRNESAEAEGQNDQVDAWPLLAECPPESLYWSGLGWLAGVEYGKELVYKEIAQAGRDVAHAAAPILRWPSHAELVARRGEAG